MISGYFRTHPLSFGLILCAAQAWSGARKIVGYCEFATTNFVGTGSVTTGVSFSRLVVQRRGWTVSLAVIHWRIGALWIQAGLECWLLNESHANCKRIMSGKKWLQNAFFNTQRLYTLYQFLYVFFMYFSYIWFTNLYTPQSLADFSRLVLQFSTSTTTFRASVHIICSIFILYYIIFLRTISIALYM